MGRDYHDWHDERLWFQNNEILIRTSLQASIFAEITIDFRYFLSWILPGALQKSVVFSDFTKDFLGVWHKKCRFQGIDFLFRCFLFVRRPVRTPPKFCQLHGFLSSLSGHPKPTRNYGCDISQPHAPAHRKQISRGGLIFLSTFSSNGAIYSVQCTRNCARD